MLCWRTFIHLLTVSGLVHSLKMALDNQRTILSTPQKYIPMENTCCISKTAQELYYNMVVVTNLKTNKLSLLTILLEQLLTPVLLTSFYR